MPLDLMKMSSASNTINDAVNHREIISDFRIVNPGFLTVLPAGKMCASCFSLLLLPAFPSLVQNHLGNF